MIIYILVLSCTLKNAALNLFKYGYNQIGFIRYLNFDLLNYNQWWHVK